MSVLTVCPFGLKQIVPTNKMINISNSLETSHFIDRTRTHSQSSNFARITILRNGLFSPLFSNMSFSSETNCVHQSEMINTSNNLGTCQFIDRTRTHFAKY